MTKINLDTKELERLIKKIEESPKTLKEAKRTAFEEAAPRMKRLLDVAIGGTGKVQSWQKQHVGSEGGYAAVRPKAKTFTKVNGRGKRYAVGHVTNAINSGHRFPRPSGKAKKKYKERVKINRQKVPGRLFYEIAEDHVPEVAQATAQQVVDALMEHLEG